jgi:hypothetical protein
VTTVRYDHNDVVEIADLLMGRRIVHVDLDKRLLQLDNGTEIEVEPNEGGCACSAGDYELTHLATVENIITDVRVVNDPSGDDYNGPSYQHTGYSIFVVADATEINAVQIDGDDGNGYYGTGYRLIVKPGAAPPVIQEEP